jgi:hypothetical protein
MSIKAFVEKVLTDKSSNLQKIELGKVTDAEIEFLKETVSLDLTDYCRVLDNSGICHAFKKHGDAKIEAQRGQIAITPDDFENILELVQNPDFVAYVGKNRGSVTECMLHLCCIFSPNICFNKSIMHIIFFRKTYCFAT